MIVLRWICFGIALVASFFIGVWTGSLPSRWRLRRWLTLRAMLVHRVSGDGWISGRELIDQSKGAIGRSWIRIVMSELEFDKLVESKPEANPHPGIPPRRLYRLTDRGASITSSVNKGRAELEEGGGWE